MLRENLVALIHEHPEITEASYTREKRDVLSRYSLLGEVPCFNLLLSNTVSFIFGILSDMGERSPIMISW
ncbi:MAG: hypothetical protein Fur0022_38240 [Anaerolineales bacterium]